MTDADVIDLVRGALIEAKPQLADELGDLGLDTRFETIRMDSLDTLKMITVLEDRLGCVLEGDDLSKVSTVRDLGDLLREMSS